VTVAIPEAVGAVEGRAAAGAASRKTAQGQVISSRTARTRRTYDARVTGTRRQRPARQAPPSGPAPAPAAPDGAATAAGGGKYQGAILAEFLIAALIVAFAPIAAGPKDDKGGPSPYRVGDLAQLAALGVVYFLLAVWSGTGKGRMAAWFGFLILLAVLFRKTASGELNAEAAPLTGKQPKDEFGGGDIGTQPPSGPPTGNFS